MIQICQMTKNNKKFFWNFWKIKSSNFQIKIVEILLINKKKMI